MTPGIERQPSEATTSPSNSLKTGLTTAYGPSSSPTCTTMMRLPIPTCGAARPMPGAACIVSIMSSMSCCVSGIFNSRSLTFFATFRRTGSGSTTMRRTYAMRIRNSSENIVRQVLIFHNLGEPVLHVGFIDRDAAGRFGRFERYHFQDALEHRVQPSGADIFRLLVDLGREYGDRVDAAVRKIEHDPVGCEQLPVLLDERVLRLRQDGFEVFLRQAVELHADGKPSLQLRNHVAGLADVECTRSDEQHVVCPHRSILRHHGRALDDRQDVALYAFAGDVGADAAGPRTACDLVHFVDENDAVALRAPHGLALEGVVVEQLRRLFLNEDIARLRDRHAA